MNLVKGISLICLSVFCKVVFLNCKYHHIYQGSSELLSPILAPTIASICNLQCIKLVKDQQKRNAQLYTVYCTELSWIKSVKFWKGVQILFVLLKKWNEGGFHTLASISPGTNSIWLYWWWLRQQSRPSKPSGCARCLSSAPLCTSIIHNSAKSAPPFLA